jgi:hypothetical protein
MSSRTINGVKVQLSRYDAERFDKGLWKPKIKKPVEVKEEPELKVGENETLTETKYHFKGGDAKTK